jgi:UDP-N-acetylmuramyl pentapeptide phosphotransferase/UDP-N-acetylglucosamine-1-phosphate transferase
MVRRKMPIMGLRGGIDIVIPHWAILFLCSSFTLPVVLFLILPAVSLALIPFNDWYILRRTAQRESTIEHLEALLALDDSRGIGRPQVQRARGPR